MNLDPEPKIKPETKTWVTVTIIVALIGCVATLGAALISVLLNNSNPPQPVYITEVPQNQNASNVEIPAGNWKGTIASNDGSFSAELNLSFQQSCSINEVCGIYDVPEIQCSGTLTLVSAEGNSFVFIEKTTSSTSYCVNTCYEHIQKLSDGSITYGCSQTGNPNDIGTTGTLNRP